MRQLAFLLPLPAILLSAPVYAKGDLSRVKPTEIVIEMGRTPSGKNMYLKPKHLDLETGKAYKIVLRNMDEEKHEFAGHEFIEKVFTRKVEISEPSGNLIAEIKGSIREIEIGPKWEATWFIVPVQTGENLEMVCEIEGHKKAGMVGTVTIR